MSPTPARFVAEAASLVEARRPVPRLDPQPDAEELRARHRRRGIRAALARAGHAPLGAVRDPEELALAARRRGLR